MLSVGALLLGSCGGGGAAGTNEGGNLLILPLTGTFFAGVPSTMTIQGGRRPYRLTSSEPGILPVPNTLDANTFTVIPNNPGVIDSGVAVNELPVRTVIVSVTDQTNGFNTATIQVAQNFLTGYGVRYLSNCPSQRAAAAAPQACAGGETAIQVEANFTGALIGNRTYRLDILRGPYSWVFSPGGAIVGNSITVVTDHQGKTNAVFRVNGNVATQIGIFRITDVATGVSTEQVFVIQGTDITSTLTLVPNEFTFTGADNTRCGTGSATFLAFDGTPPYRAVSSFASVEVTPSSTSSQPGQFLLSVTDAGTCLENATIVVTDANNARGTVTVTTTAGSADPPPAALRVVPSSLTVACGQTVSRGDHRWIGHVQRRRIGSCADGIGRGFHAERHRHARRAGHRSDGRYGAGHGDRRCLHRNRHGSSLRGLQLIEFLRSATGIPKGMPVSLPGPECPLRRSAA